MGRRKGSGTLVKRGKVWLAKWTVDGKTYFKSTKCADKREALKKLDDFTRPFQCETEIEQLEALQAKIHVQEAKLADGPDEYADCELDEVVDKWLSMANAPEIAASTKDGYNGMANKLLEFGKQRRETRVKDVDFKFVEAYLESIKDVVGAGRYNSTIALFKRVWADFAAASKHRCFKTNPWQSFKYRKAAPSVKRELTVEELARLVDASKEDEDMNLLLCIGLYTGLRLGDCCKLRWKEVDLIRQTICRVPEKTKTKTHAVVNVPIHPVLLGKLVMARSKSSGEYVSETLAEAYTTGKIGYKIDLLFKKANVEKHETIDGKKRTVCSFHSLRHTFVSMAASSGVSLDVLKTLVGHASTSMTSHYAHMSNAALMGAVTALPDFGNGVAEEEAVRVEKRLLDKVASIGYSINEALEEWVKSKECRAIICA